MAVTIEHGPEHQRSRGAGRAVAFTALVSALLGAGYLYLNSGPHAGSSSANGSAVEIAESTRVRSTALPEACDPQHWSEHYSSDIVDAGTRVPPSQWVHLVPDSQFAYVCDPSASEKYLPNSDLQRPYWRGVPRA